MLTVLGIDPGLNKLGYSIVEEKNGILDVIDYGRINPPTKLPFNKKITYLYNKLKGIIENFKPEIIGIEEIYLDKNVQITLKIGEVIGMVMGLGVDKNIDFILIPTREIKKNIVGTGAATKEQVKYMIENLTKVSEIKNFDESDAIAVAISCINSKKKNDLLY